MSKHDVREVIAHARERQQRQRQHDRPLAERLATAGQVTVVSDAVRAADIWAEGRALPRAPSYRWRLPRPKPQPAPPPGPTTYVLTTADHVETGEGCAGALAENAVGMIGKVTTPNTLWAQAAPPNGDDATVWFTFDPPEPGFAYISTVVHVSGSMQGTIARSNEDAHFHFAMYATCHAYQLDHGNAQYSAYQIDNPVIDPKQLAASGYSITELWNDAAYAPSPILIGVEPSSVAGRPVAISAGVAIAVSVDGAGATLQWDFCPAITVPAVVVNFVPASSWVVG